MGLSLAKSWWNRAVALADRYPRPVMVIGLLAALWIALAPTADFVPVTPDFVKHKLETPDEDMRRIYVAASQASWSDLPKWFAGPWIYTNVGYYRPVTSILFYAEHRAFDKNFTAYNRVTWLMHGLNAALLYLLVLSLFRHHPRGRLALALIAVYCFAALDTTETSPVVFSIRWWPAQNDILSLTFGLLCLLLLDRYLLEPRRRRLVATLAAFVTAICTKETAHILVPIALALIWHRRHRPTPLMAVFALLSGALLLWRKIVVPNPWGKFYYSPVILRRVMVNWFGPPFYAFKSEQWRALAASAVITAFVSIGIRRRWPVYKTAALATLAAGVCEQFIGIEGSWAMLLIPQEMSVITNLLVYFLGIALLWRFRQLEPGILSVAAFALAFVPGLWYVGYHYYYWPSAFQALANATFCACLWRWAQELRAWYSDSKSPTTSRECRVESME